MWLQILTGLFGALCSHKFKWGWFGAGCLFQVLLVYGMLVTGGFPSDQCDGYVQGKARARYILKGVQEATQATVQLYAPCPACALSECTAELLQMFGCRHWACTCSRKGDWQQQALDNISRSHIMCGMPLDYLINLKEK